MRRPAIGLRRPRTSRWSSGLEWSSCVARNSASAVGPVVYLSGSIPHRAIPARNRSPWRLSEGSRNADQRVAESRIAVGPEALERSRRTHPSGSRARGRGRVSLGLADRIERQQRQPHSPAPVPAGRSCRKRSRSLGLIQAREGASSSISVGSAWSLGRRAARRTRPRCPLPSGRPRPPREPSASGPARGRSGSC